MSCEEMVKMILEAEQDWDSALLKYGAEHNVTKFRLCRLAFLLDWVSPRKPAGFGHA